MSAAINSDRETDVARDLICQVIARMVRSGVFTLRSRIVRSADEPAIVMFYGHSTTGWQKDSDVSDPEMVQALEETLEMLASKGRGDNWSTKTRSSADYHDTDIRFHNDKLLKRDGEALESVVMGLLFRDSHDSKQDCRRSIRKRR